MLKRILSIALSLTLAGLAAGATGDLVAPVLCTITGTVQTPPSYPHDSMYTYERLALCKKADTAMVLNVPVPACTVWALTPISSRQFFGITDNAGRYKIDSIPVSGSHDTISIVATKQGYVEVSRKVALAAGTVAADFTIEKSPVTNTNFTGSKGDPTKKIQLRLTNSGRSVLSDIAANRIESVALFALDGRMIDRWIGTELMAADGSRLSLPLNSASGAAVIRVRGDGWSEIRQLLIR